MHVKRCFKETEPTILHTPNFYKDEAVVLDSGTSSVALGDFKHLQNQATENQAALFLYTPICSMHVIACFVRHKYKPVIVEVDTK